MSDLNLHIGSEKKNPELEAAAAPSKHVLNLKKPIEDRREKNHDKAHTNLKDEIKASHKKAGRICIVGQLSRAQQGLGRLPMIAAALVTIMVLNMGQLFFLGTREGSESLALAAEAFTTLQGAGTAVINGEPGSDAVLFQQADELFQEAREKGDFLLASQTPWIQAPKEVTSFQNLISAGEKMTDMGEHMSAIRVALNEIPEEGSITEFIRDLSVNHIQPAGTTLDEINLLLDDVDLSGTGYQAQFVEYRSALDSVAGMFDTWEELQEPILYAMGDRYVQHYMVVFMNNNEMRAGGGFMGSFAIAQVNDGRLDHFTFHDIYDFSDQLYEDIPLPVHELEELTDQWRLHDANVSPDFPTSAQHIMRLLEKSGGPGVDGVIAVNLSAAEAMLLQVGDEIQVPSLEKPIYTAHFGQILSTLVEGKSFAVENETSPKVILGEVIDSFLTELKDPLNQVNIGLEALKQSRDKQILIYHEHPAVQKMLVDLGMSSSLPDFNALESDYFMPVFTNIGGNKMDAYVHTAIMHDTHIFFDGAIADSITLRRSNTWQPEALTWLKGLTANYGFYDWDDELERIMGDDIAKSGIRFYLPEGSQILETKGVHRHDLQFYYDQDLDHSYYYLRQELGAGETKDVQIIYTPPTQLTEDIQEYEFQLLKQPGLKNVRYEKTVHAPDNNLLTTYPLANEKRPGVDYTYTDAFKRDLQLKVLVD
jgi:hypothetical protein